MTRRLDVESQGARGGTSIGAFHLTSTTSRQKILINKCLIAMLILKDLLGHMDRVV